MTDISFGTSYTIPPLILRTLDRNQAIIKIILPLHPSIHLPVLDGDSIDYSGADSGGDSSGDSGGDNGR